MESGQHATTRTTTTWTRGDGNSRCGRFAVAIPAPFVSEHGPVCVKPLTTEQRLVRGKLIRRFVGRGKPSRFIHRNVGTCGAASPPSGVGRGRPRRLPIEARESVSPPPSRRLPSAHCLLTRSNCHNVIDSAIVSPSSLPPLSRIMRMNHQSPISTSPSHTRYPLSTLHPRRTPHNPSNIARV